MGDDALDEMDLIQKVWSLRLTAKDAPVSCGPCYARPRYSASAVQTNGVYHSCCPPRVNASSFPECWSPFWVLSECFRAACPSQTPSHAPWHHPNCPWSILPLPSPTWRGACCSEDASSCLSGKDTGTREMKESTSSYIPTSGHQMTRSGNIRTEIFLLIPLLCNATLFSLSAFLVHSRQ